MVLNILFFFFSHALEDRSSTVESVKLVEDRSPLSVQLIMVATVYWNEFVLMSESIQQAKKYLADASVSDEDDLEELFSHESEWLSV